VFAGVLLPQQYPPPAPAVGGKWPPPVYDASVALFAAAVVVAWKEASGGEQEIL
jgi:hypothetical protein